VQAAESATRALIASFDVGRITSDAGSLPLGAADKVIGVYAAPGGLLHRCPQTDLGRARGRDAGHAASV
jgi:hypothetical protein